RRSWSCDATPMNDHSERPPRLAEHRLIAEAAQRTNEPRAQQRAARGLAGNGLPSDAIEHRPKRCARIGRKRSLARTAALKPVHAAQGTDDLIGHAAMIVAGQLVRALECG